MSSFLRKVVAGPRAPHPEANLDLCYVTDNIVATSGPSATYPSRAYRNPLDQLVKFLDSKHGQNWFIWEFRAEGTGYPDDAVYGRIKHFPWPDHHPPPFKLIPGIVGSMREWIHGVGGAEVAKIQTNGSQDTQDTTTPQDRVIVVHCKAGKGRSGSMAVAYLISQEGWSRTDALQRFTERRMRPGFGSGVSIPSQLRWIGYVERWAQNGKQYLERAVEVKEVHVWGLREGVKVGVEGYVDEGRKIQTFHLFSNEERDDFGEKMVLESATGSNQVDGQGEDRQGSPGSRAPPRSNTSSKGSKDDMPALLSVVTEVMKSQKRSLSIRRSNSKPTSRRSSRSPPANRSSQRSRSLEASEERDDSRRDSSPRKPGSQSASSDGTRVKTTNTIFRPEEPIILPTSDINISLERRARASYGWAVVTSVAHVWFNAFFEGQGPERLKERNDTSISGAVMNTLTNSTPDGPERSGVFEISWEQLDGVKGSARKGARALDKLQVVWQVREDTEPDVSPVPTHEHETMQHHIEKLQEDATKSDEDHRGRKAADEETQQRESFESAQETQNATKSIQNGVLITEPTHPGDVQDSQPANWIGSAVRKAGSIAGSPMARRLGPRPNDPEADQQGQDGKDQGDSKDRWKAAREDSAGEEQPELDDNSDEDGTEGIDRGVRLSVDDGHLGQQKKSKLANSLQKVGLEDAISAVKKSDSETGNEKTWSAS
ncbi:MAG: hypothetical protein Q9162_002640 [Coniocarpon cinnabarinum]